VVEGSVLFDDVRVGPAIAVPTLLGTWLHRRRRQA
jgi:hypothetical protein